MTALAVVSAAHADGSGDLEFELPARCAGCRGTCLWRRLDAARLARVPLPRGLHAGMRVRVSLPERDVLRGALIVHGAPWAGLLGGAAAGAGITSTDAGTLAGGVLGLVATVVLVQGLRRRRERATLAGLRIEPGE